MRHYQHRKQTVNIKIKVGFFQIYFRKISVAALVFCISSMPIRNRNRLKGFLREKFIQQKQSSLKFFQTKTKQHSSNKKLIINFFDNQL